jgi:hypothetical protein
MQRIDGHLEHLKERDKPPDPVDTANKDERSPRVSKEEIVQVEVLYVSKMGSARAHLQS